MIATLDDIEFETRTVGPLVLTTPVLRRLGLAEIVDRVCPIAEQADMGHGVIAELAIQCRLTEPQALYDMPDWADRYGIAALYSELERAEQLNDDRVGRMLDAIYDRRALIWGELIAGAARMYEIDLSRLHADTAPIKFAGLFADQPEDESVPRLEPGYNSQGEWVQQLKLFALAAGDGGLTGHRLGLGSEQLGRRVRVTGAHGSSDRALELRHSATAWLGTALRESRRRLPGAESLPGGPGCG